MAPKTRNEDDNQPRGPQDEAPVAIGADQPATATDVKELIRGVLAVFEANQLNSAQRIAVRNVRVLLGDEAPPVCSHDAGDHFDADDNRLCDACGERI